MLRHLDFYTDGAFSSKTEMGGWACICIEDDFVIDTTTGFEPYTTNNRCELLGMLSALEHANTIESGHTEVSIYTDSAYVANCFNQGWYQNWLKNGWRTADRQQVKNQDLWTRIIALYIKLKPRLNLQIVLVKGHSPNRWNHYVDALAVQARTQPEE